MLNNGVRELTATAGTGTVTLTQVTGYARFSDGFSVSGLASYAISDGNNWEWGVGTVGVGNTLARTTITGSLVAGTYTTGGAAITLASGAASVFNVDHTGTVRAISNLTGNVTSVGNATTLASIPAISGANLTSLTAANIAAGTAGINITGNSATVTTNANLTGDVTSSGNATTLTNAPVIAKVLTGYTSGAGTVSATDSILQAIQKLNGNDATNADLTGPVTSIGNATAIANGAISNAMLANSAVANLSGTNTGDQTSIVGITGTIAQFNTAITDGDLATGGGTATGTNTGDQTITLTGGVTGSGTGSFAATVITNANLTGVVTSTGNATAIADTALSIAKTSGLQAALDLKAPLASPTFTGTVTVPTPVNATDAATKGYTDALKQALDIKDSVRVASTANIAVASALINGSTIDGVLVATGERVLLKNQTATAENGIWVVVASGAASRSTDADVSAEVTTGLYTFVSEGTASAGTGFVLTTADPITLGTTGLTFTEFSGAGQVIAGNGLTETGNTLSINTAITADLSTVQTFTNKSISGGQITSAVANATLAANVTTNANLTGGVTSVGNAATVITNANLTGGVTSVGNAATVITNANLTGDVTSSGNATTLTNAPVIAKVLTGYTSGAGTVAATDSILQAIQKLNGNTAAIVGGAALSNDTTTATNVYPIFAAATSGTPSTVYTSNAKLLYKPSTGELQASVPIALNGLFVNATTLVASYTVASGQSAQSVGGTSGFTIPSGLSVTLSSGSRWVVL